MKHLSSAIMVAVAAIAMTFVAAGTASATAQQVSSGGTHACAIFDGAAMCWGNNAHGQLGDGTADDSSVPVQVVGLESGVAAISAGSDHTCAVVASGAAWCWGSNMDSQLGDGMEPEDETESFVPVPVAGLSAGVSSVSAGFEHTCARLSTAVRCWGGGDFGKLGNGSVSSSSVPVPVSGLGFPVSSVSVDGKTSCADGMGRVYCWGLYDVTQSGGNVQSSIAMPVVLNPPPVSTHVDVGFYHTCVSTNSNVNCWGANLYQQVGDGGPSIWLPTPGVDVYGPPVAGADLVSAGRSLTCARVSPNVQCWGNGNPIPAEVDGITTPVTAVSAGGFFACAIDAGVVKCWGENDRGQLGDGTTDASDAAVRVAGQPDLNPPTISILAPTGITADMTPQLDLDVFDGETSVVGDPSCSLDGGPAFDCVDGYTLPALNEGNHQLAVRAVDEAGNEGVSYGDFTIDTTNPVVSIDSPVDGSAITNTSPALLFSVGETNPGSTECQVDDGAYFSCYQAITLGDLVLGPHSVKVRHADAAGNVGTSPQSNFTIVEALPVVEIASPANGALYDGAPVPVAYSVDTANPGATECAIDGSAYGACPADLVLADGPHTMTVRHTDADGHVGSANVSFTVDGSAPEVTISSPTPGAQYRGAVPVAFSVNDFRPGGEQCSVDDGPYTECPANLGLGDGLHTLTVRSTDLAGNVGSTAVSFTVETTTPTEPPPILPPPAVASAPELPGGAPLSISTTTDAQGNASFVIPMSEAAQFPGGEVPLTLDFSIPAGAGVVSDVRLRWVPEFVASPNRTVTATPSGSDWTATISIPASGSLFLLYTITEGATSQQFVVPYGGVTLIDPQGVVFDQNAYNTLVGMGVSASQARQASALSGATVTLQREVAGTWNNVISGDPGISPHINPEVTGVDGKFQWDVAAGRYRVVVALSGYQTATTSGFDIPPPKLDAHVGLAPTGGGQASGNINCSTLSGRDLTACHLIDSLAQKLMAKVCGVGGGLWRSHCESLAMRIANAKKARLIANASRR